VRVFDVQHIKGLEFEAVFFVGADLLAENIPELFDKYLYVGATRAATFFGITCHNTAPKLINNLRSSFQQSWA
jgi:DNA helicase IV